VTDYDKIILELREENKRLKPINDNLIKSNDSLVKSVNELKQKLAYYENPHSPPSSNSLQWRKQKAEKRQKNNGKSNRGGIQGHIGATQKFTPQHITNHLNVLNVAAQTSLK